MKTAIRLFFCLVFLAPGLARADVTIAPLRQVLDSENTEARFVVSNPSERIVSGEVSWIDLTATETGYADATPSARQRMSAAPWLALSPAQFELSPGERIEVSVRLREGAKPPPGERRSHLLVVSAPARTLLRKAGHIGLQVDIGAGVSTPVLLRGDGAADVTIGETQLLRDTDGLLLLSTTIVSSGEHSAFGSLTVEFNADGAQAPQRLAARDNVAAYIDATERRFELPLGFFSLGAGELTIRYEGADEYNGRLFDERSFRIKPPDGP
ncbi:MAG: hypothetical protein AAFW81_04750 [Pseudomonadota bacterium]